MQREWMKRKDQNSFLDGVQPAKGRLVVQKRRIKDVNKALEKRGTSIGKVEESKICERRGEWRNFVKDSQADTGKSTRWICEKGDNRG